VDGSSCVIAILIFALLVKERKNFSKDPNATVLEVASVFKDKIFWIFLFVSFVTAMIFFQLFTTRCTTVSNWFNRISNWFVNDAKWTFNLCTRNAICRLF
jgi:TRAP-type C4-dicarboxylate transport system permease large subunit